MAEPASLVNAGKSLEAKQLQELVKEQIEQPRGDSSGIGAPRDAILRIPVTVQVILGSARVPVAKVMEFGPGSVITLDQKLGEPVTLMANGREIAKGEIVVLNEETSQLGISLTEVCEGKPAKRPA
jgi:flagellar motor switch protein FliN/FliY